MEKVLIIAAIIAAAAFIKFFMDFEVIITHNDGGGYSVRFGLSIKKA